MQPRGDLAQFNTGRKAKFCVRSYSRYMNYLCRFLVEDGAEFRISWSFIPIFCGKGAVCLMNPAVENLAFRAVPLFCLFILFLEAFLACILILLKLKISNDRI